MEIKGDAKMYSVIPALYTSLEGGSRLINLGRYYRYISSWRGYLRRMKAAHGHRSSVLVCGNGPSLKALNEEEFELYDFVIVCNGFHRIFPNVSADLCILADGAAVQNYSTELAHHKCLATPIHTTLNYHDGVLNRNHCRYPNNRHLGGLLGGFSSSVVSHYEAGEFAEDYHVNNSCLFFSRDPGLFLPSYFSVAYAMMQVAFYIRPKLIKIAGIDLNYDPAAMYANESYVRLGDVRGVTNARGMAFTLRSALSVFNSAQQPYEILTLGNWHL